MNNDGIDDLIIGAPNADSGSYTYNDRGASYVVFGSEAGFSAQLDLTKLDGSNGFVINGINRYDRSGTSVSSAGDVNGDGIDDLIIGAPNADSGSSTYNDEGETYVVFGSEAGFSAQLDLTKLNGSNGFVIRGIDRYDNSGTSVSSAGDVNDDGIDDLIIGAPNNGGETYVVFGSKTGFSAQLNLANPNDIDGFVIKGNNIGRSISGAGDVNGDGVDDLIVGAPNANSRGASYVIFGVPALKLIGTDEDDILDGGLSGDFLSGLGGDDLINGNGGNDNILGGSEDDFIRGGAGSDTVRGQTGNDDISGNAGNDKLFGDSGRDDIFGDSGNDTIRGGSAADRLFGDAGNDDIRGGTGDDRIFGGTGNDLLLGNSGVDRIAGENGNDRIHGGLGDDILQGNAGNDLIIGNSGEDELAGNDGNDRLNGGSEDDILTGGNGNDRLNGGSEDDTLTGGSGNDRLNGNQDNDLLIGIDSTDSDLGLGEQDTLTGGANKDTFVLANENGLFYDDGDATTSGVDDFALITDFKPSQDTIQLQGSADLYSLDFFTSGAGTINARLIFDPGVTAVGEVIAVLQNVDPSLSVDDSAFSFV